MLYKREYLSPVGMLIISSTETNIVEISFADRSSHETYDQNENISPLTKAIAWLDNYFQGENPCITSIPFLTSGTVFQKKIWDRLCRIPYGTTVTYGEIANEIAKENGILKMSAQAVGQAVRKNPIGIIIPCHRVIGSNGKLTGFSGGIDKKKLLLEFEANYAKQLGLF